MHESRRAFLSTIGGATACLAATQRLLGQRSITPPPPPQPADTHVPYTSPKGSRHDAVHRALLEKSEREFRAGIEELYRLTSELRNEVQKTTTSDVLSVGVYRKTQEIENLAKQLKKKAAHAIS